MTNAYNNYFVLEGLDGSGKTTQIKAIKELYGKLKEDNPTLPNLVITKEPGGTEWGQKLRTLMLNGGSDDEIALALAMFSDRVQTMQYVIKPALNDGSIVLSDRSVLSTLAYQGVSPLRYETINYIITALSPFLIEPRMIYLLDVPVEVAMGYSKKADVFERSGTGFYKGVRTRYLEIAEQWGVDKVTVIDGMKEERVITDFILDDILGYVVENTLSERN